MRPIIAGPAESGPINTDADIAPWDGQRMTTAAARVAPIAAGIPAIAADIPENS